MSEKRDSYIFYRSFYEAMEDLNDSDQLTIYRTISIYALEGKEPEISGFPKAIFSLIKPILEANRKRWENGNKGGRPKNQKGTEEEPNENQELTKTKATETKPKANKDKELDKDKNKDDKLFVPPTLDEVTAYIKENNLNVTPGTFFECYSGSQWIDKNGKTVKNWKLKAQTWSKKADNKGEYNRVEASNCIDLGAGEFIVDGKRCYGNRNHPVQIPDGMSPRPSLQYCLDRENHKWIIQ